jgi:DNA-binding NtrC family response regulator
MAAVAAAVPGPVGALPSSLPPQPERLEAEEDGDEGEPADEGSSSLASVAKAAAIKAERAAIEQTLRQVHWNRRKAAQHLGVSYKTLLNKIKECGISRG